MFLRLKERIICNMNNRIIKQRLVSQQLAVKQFDTPSQLVAYMGAVQAQDFGAATLAVGLRLRQSTENDVIEAFNRGEILRTHVLRPTWHFVARELLRPLVALSAKRNRAASAVRDKQLEITEKLFAQSNAILRNVLKGKRHLTKKELAAEYERHKISIDASRMYHFLYRAETEAIICGGALKGKSQTYALLDERAPADCSVTMSDYAPLLEIYLRSHSPATLNDFAWWSGATLTDARQALEAVMPHLTEERIDGKTYYIHNEAINATSALSPSVFLLPAYDEYLIAYADRSAALTTPASRTVVSSNGIFRPVIVVDGQVRGAWKTVGVTKNIVLEWFEQPDAKIKHLTDKAIEIIRRLNNNKL
jgi:hypothetical protein